MKLKNGDFIEINFVGRLKDTNQIFDLTDEETAKKNSIYDPKGVYGPLVICIGEGDVLQGLDEALAGKEIGKTFSITLPPEKAFGKKDMKLIQLIPISKFREQNVAPYPGLQVSVNNLIGTIKTVSGGRILVDFNHPLSGKEVVYEVTINKLVVDDAEKINGFMRTYMQIPKSEIEVKEGLAKIKLDVPENFRKLLEERIKKRMQTIKKVEFVHHAQKNK